MWPTELGYNSRYNSWRVHAYRGGGAQGSARLCPRQPAVYNLLGGSSGHRIPVAREHSRSLSSVRAWNAPTFDSSNNRSRNRSVSVGEDRAGMSSRRGDPLRRVQLEEFYSVQDPLCVLCRQGVIPSPHNLHDQIMQLTAEYQSDGVRVLCMEYYCDFCHVLFDASVLAQYLSLRRFLRSIPAECLPSYIFREWSCSIVQFINHTLQGIPIHPREPFIPPHHELNLWPCASRFHILLR